ncbi:hypothetical protein [Mycobacteroides abscessus]|uniref:hypothetical protein n=2 Tax=Mycobacteroides abscessus TaxID=36809 RepID=UPI001041D587|nr:hypothetical protein [Mycobacteroides abscessus]
MNVEIEQGVIQPVADQKAGASSGLGSGVVVPVAAIAAAPVGAPESSQMTALEAENEGLAAEVRDLRRQLSVSGLRLNQIVEAAHRLADEYDWCSVFDDFCEEHGLPLRTRDYTVSVSVTLSLELVKNARSADHLQSDIIDDIVSEIGSLSRGDLITVINDWSVTTVRDA